MENFNIPERDYNLAGKYAKSERKFRKYIMAELNFYRSLNELAIKNSQYGPKANKFPEKSKSQEDSLHHIF